MQLTKSNSYAPPSWYAQLNNMPSLEKLKSGPLPRVDCAANLEHGVPPGGSKLWAFFLDEILEYMLRPICGLHRAILLETNHRSLLPWVEKYVVRDVHAVPTERNRCRTQTTWC